MSRQKSAHFLVAIILISQNDLNTSLAITTIFDVLKSDLNDKTKIVLLKKFDDVLDIGIKDLLVEKGSSKKIETETFPENIINLAETRLLAKKTKDFTKADEIRDIIRDEGYEIIDTKEGYKLSRLK